MKTTSRPLRAQVLSAALLIAAAGAAAAAPPAATGPEPAVHRIPGGPRVLLIPQRSVPMFSCTVLVPAGSALETPATNGAAHYLEHLLFNGTTTRTREQIYAETDLLGAYNNASTQRERTVFQLLLPSENRRAGLELQADMLLHSTLPPAMFEKEKGIILEELAKDRSSSDYEAGRFVERVLWGDDPRSLPVVGTEESISGMDPDAVGAFYHDRYRPAGMTIVLMGDFDPDGAIAELETLYGGGDGVVPQPTGRPPFPAEPAVHTLDLPDLGKTRVTVMLPMPGVSSPDFAAAELLATVLSDGEHAAVTRAVEAACGPALSCAASLDAGSPWSLLSIGVDLPVDASGGEVEGVPGPAVGAVLSHLRDLAGGDGGAIARDLPAARLGTIVEEISLQEKMHYYGLMRADLLGSGDPRAARRFLADARRVRSGDVIAVLWRALAEGRALVTVAGPGAGEGSRALDLAPFRPTVPPVEIENTTENPGPEPPAEMTAEEQGDRVRLENGMTLVHAASLASRTFAAHLLLEGRRAAEEAAGVPRGTSDVVHRMMALGTEDMDEGALRGALASLGATLKVTDLEWIPYDDYYFSPEYSYVRLETIDSFGLDALRLLGRIVTAPRFTEETLAKARSAAAARAEQAPSTPRSAAGDLFLELGWSHHPEAGGVYGSPEDLRELTLDQVRTCWTAMTDPRNLVLTVSSDLRFDAVRDVVRAGFGGLKTGPEPAPRPLPEASPGERGETETGQEQSWIVVGEPLSVRPEDRPALRVAVAVLSERLADRLREREGLAYSIGAGARLEGEGEYVRMSAGTRPENLETMERGMLEVAAELRERPPTAAEIEGARNRNEGRRRMRRLSRIGQTYAMGMAELRGDDPLRLDVDLPALRAVTPEDVLQVAGTYLAFDAPVVAIAR